MNKKIQKQIVSKTLKNVLFLLISCFHNHVKLSNKLIDSFVSLIKSYQRTSKSDRIALQRNCVFFKLEKNQLFINL